MFCRPAVPVWGTLPPLQNPLMIWRVNDPRWSGFTQMGLAAAPCICWTMKFISELQKSKAPPSSKRNHHPIRGLSTPGQLERLLLSDEAKYSGWDIKSSAASRSASICGQYLLCFVSIQENTKHYGISVTGNWQWKTRAIHRRDRQPET